MRILHVAPYFDQAWAYGGIPRVVARLAREQAARAHDVTVLTTDVRDAQRRAEPTPAMERLSVHALPNLSNRLAYHLQLFTPVGLGGWLDARLAQFDVVHVHGCHHWLGAQVARRAGRGPRYVLSPHGTAPRLERRRLAKALFDVTAGRHVLSRAELLLAVSRAEALQLETLGVPASRVRVLSNPVDPVVAEPGAVEAFRRRFGLADLRVVLFLAKLTPRKGADTLLRAFHRVARADERLVIAGNDLGEATRLQSLTRSLGLGARVVFTGLLEGAARGGALGAASVFALPSRDEVFGIAAAEALLAGVPAVVADDSGCGELVTAARGGLAVRPGDVAALAQALRRLLDERSFRDAAPAAAAWVGAQTDPGHVTERALALYAGRPVPGRESLLAVGT